MADDSGATPDGVPDDLGPALQISSMAMSTQPAVQLKFFSNRAAWINAL